MSFSFLTAAALARFGLRRKQASTTVQLTPAPALASAAAHSHADSGLDERIGRIISDIPRRRVRRPA